MNRKLVLCFGLVGVLACASGALAQVEFTDDFEYVDYFDEYSNLVMAQDAFLANWPALYTGGTTMSIWTNSTDINPNTGMGHSDYDPTAPAAHSGIKSIHGICPQTNTARNYHYLDNAPDGSYKAHVAPMEISFWVNDKMPTNTGSRSFMEFRGYTGQLGFPPPGPPQAPGTGLPAGWESLIAMGTYNSLGTGVSTLNWAARVILPGFSAWFSLGVLRSAGWHELKALIYSGVDNGQADPVVGPKIEFYVDGVLAVTKTPTATAGPYYWGQHYDVAVLGSGLTPNTDDVSFDDLKITPEPATLLVLAAGGLFLRRRRVA